MRRPTTVELMLLAAILLWALNLSVSRYILTHGLQPLAYSSVRYGLATVVFALATLASEGTLRVARSDVPLVAFAGAVLWVNQIGFVYALKTTSASVVGLVLAATPVFAALLGLALRTERQTPRFWGGAALSFAGVALVALGTGAEVRGDRWGVLLGIVTAMTWAVYSMAIVPLMRTYSPLRISTYVLALSWAGITLVGAPQLASQEWALGWDVWALLVFATLGPLVVTNVIWFRSLHHIGPAKATLATNLQPFVAAVLAVALLGESLTLVQGAGGVLIALGIVAARGRRRAVAAA